METQLPEPIRLKLAYAIDRYPEWEGVDTGDEPPVPIRSLGNGDNNASFLVANRKSFVIRINRAEHSDNALDPGVEVAALGRAAAAGLAPPLRFSAPERGILVCDYLPPDPTCQHEPMEIARLLHCIHNLDPIEAELDLPDRLRFYLHRVQESISDKPKQQRMLDALENALKYAFRLQVEDEAACLCHNDLLAANRLVSGGQLWALDWEYAAMGSRWFDLAAVIHGDALSVEEARQLILAYLGRNPVSREQQMLKWASECYVALERAWYALNDSRQVI